MSAPAPAHGGAPPLAARVVIEQVREEAEGILTAAFSAPAGFAFEAGQHVTLRRPGLRDPRGPQRTFTLSSSPTELPFLAITTRRGESPFKQLLLAAGVQFELSGPYGRFTLDTARPALLVAGGIGITPFRSMLRWAADTHRAPEVRLLHSVGGSRQIPFRDEFEAIARALPTFRVEYTLTGEDPGEERWTGRRGRITPAWIAENLREMDRPRVYLCGPPGMVVALKQALTAEQGVAPADLRVESFSGY